MTDTEKDRQDRQRHDIDLAMRRAELTLEELWLRYFSLGGSAGLLDIDAYIHGLGGLETTERDMLAHAVNERLDELAWTHRASYSRSVRDSRPRSEPLAALVRLLKGAELAPPERLPRLVEAAGELMGVRVRLYLVDYEQQCLHPVTAGGGEPLKIDATLAGRAFQQVRALTATTTDGPLLWMPLLDGVERLGVLRVEVADESELADPGLRAQCGWLSLLIGHLVSVLGEYGDGLDRIRVSRQRSVSGELIWSLLPAMTAGVDSFVVSGVVEPRYEVSGDIFDYALSQDTATLMIADAVGHDLRSGLIAATAVAAHRSNRRAGNGLYEQARVIDEEIARQFGDAAFATAVLAEVELSSGRLRYLNAGHPPPLLMRGGKVVKPLTGGRRIPLGLGEAEVTIGEEVLEPDDWLVLYTDGITEARNSDGEYFGEARLSDFLRREAASGHPPPETARRLIKAVLAHQGGVLQDDATVLLARWTAPRMMLL